MRRHIYYFLRILAEVAHAFLTTATLWLQLRFRRSPLKAFKPFQTSGTDRVTELVFCIKINRTGERAGASTNSIQSNTVQMWLSWDAGNIWDGHVNFTTFNVESIHEGEIFVSGSLHILFRRRGATKGRWRSCHFYSWLLFGCTISALGLLLLMGTSILTSRKCRTVAVRPMEMHKIPARMARK